MCIYVYIYIYICMYVCMYAWPCVAGLGFRESAAGLTGPADRGRRNCEILYVYIHTHTYHIDIYIHKTCVYIYIYIYIYTCMHTYIILCYTLLHYIVL